MRYLHLRSCAVRQVEPYHAGVPPHSHMREPCARGVEGGAYCAVLPRKCCRCCAVTVAIGQFDRFLISIAKDAETSDRHGAWEPLAAAETEFDQTGDARRVHEFTGQAALGVLSRLDNESRPAELPKGCRCRQPSDAGSSDDYVHINVRHADGPRSAPKPRRENSCYRADN